eukprot:gene7386-8619_t
MWYDTIGALTFISCTLYMLLVGGGAGNLRTLVVTAMIIVWASRLGMFLATRILQGGGHDRRFDGVRDNPPKLAFYWFMQSLWVALTLTPLMALHYAEEKAYADLEKRWFSRLKANEGKWIDTGLWHYCRHPNYVGEMTMHWCIYFFSIRAMSLPQAIVSLVAPLFVTFLMTQISAPMLEAIGERHESEYSERAFRFVTEKLLNHGNEDLLTLIHVVELVEPSILDPLGDNLDKINNIEEEEVGEKLRRAYNKKCQDLDTIDELRPDMVVVGSRGHGVLRRHSVP